MRGIRLIAFLVAACLPGLSFGAESSLPEADWLLQEAVTVLPWELELVSDEAADKTSMAGVPECRASRILVLRALQPLREGPAGPVVLEISLTALQFDSAEHARFALESALYSADPDTGLSYAWDLLAAAGAELYLVHAPCLVQERRWESLSDRFVELLAARHSELATARCRCGGGCRQLE